MPVYTTQQITDRTQGQLIGRGDLLIRGVDQLDTAGPEHLTFIRDPHHLPRWEKSRALAALVWMNAPPHPGSDRAFIRVPDPDLAIAVALEMFAPPAAKPPHGVHPTAHVHPSATIGQHVAIGPGCTIGPNAKIGDHCTLHAQVSVYELATLGDRCELHSGVVIRERCVLGKHVIIHSNAVIGSDGFGYRPDPHGRGLVKIPQIGHVHIGDDVEIGAATCIDRGKFAATTIGDGTKIDNLCQIAHNCRIGRCCILAGQVGLAGSVTLGDGAIIGGQVGIAEHINIGAGARIAARSGVMHDAPPGATWYGSPAMDSKVAWREIAALRKLPGLIKQWRTKNRTTAPSDSNP
jgi:UDP-3-O-[3-hydroxymyristoyl] glucosamine N-acyltransferase